jgi:nitrate/nitrite transporter NarK
MEIKNTKLSILSWALADLYFILSVTVAMLFGILLPNIQQQLTLTTTQLGLLGFAFFISFGVMQFATGSIIDLKGPRITLTLSALTATIGFFLLSIAKSFTAAIIAQVIGGVGLSITYVGAIYLAEIGFSKKQFPIISGITQMSANIVSALVLYLIAITGVVSADFRIIAKQLSLAALVLALLIFLFVHNAPSPHKKSLFGKNLSPLFQNSQIWFVILYFSTNFGVFLAFSSLWNIPDSLAYGHTLETATMLSATLRLGGAFGAILSGFLVHRIGTSSLVMKWYSTCALCLGSFLILGPTFPVPLTFIIMGLTGFFFGGTALCFPFISRHIPLSLKGAGFGLMTSLGYLLGAFLEYLVGALIGPISAISTITPQEFKFAFLPFIVILCIGWICALKMREPLSQRN